MEAEILSQALFEIGESGLTGDMAMGSYGDAAPLMAVTGKQEAVGIGEGAAVDGVYGNSDAVEFFDDASEAEGSRVPDPLHRTPLLQVEDSVIGQDSLNGSFVKRDVENLFHLSSDGGP
jgi:hypothetical protein